MDIVIPITYSQLNINVAHTDEATVVTATAVIAGTVYETVESSKKDERDKANSEIGIKLAAGRAIRQLGRNILRDANDLVRQQEHARLTAEIAKKKRKRASAAKAAKYKRLHAKKDSTNETTKKTVKKAAETTSKKK